MLCRKKLKKEKSIKIENIEEISVKIYKKTFYCAIKPGEKIKYKK